jgi:catechol 2,3-dioxygenase-like lactoylglutathione lyase family enzyme
MRGFALFAAGIGVGILLMQPVIAQNGAQKDAGMKLNHVGIAVKNFDEAVAYYTKTMGFRPAFAFKNADGTPALTYLQISRDTFLEIQPATAERPVGISHLGIETGDAKATVARLKRMGVKVDEVTPSARTGALLTNAFDTEGIRTELLEFGPASLQRKAMAAWK